MPTAVASHLIHRLARFNVCARMQKGSESCLCRYKY